MILDPFIIHFYLNFAELRKLSIQTFAEESWTQNSGLNSVFYIHGFCFMLTAKVLRDKRKENFGSELHCCSLGT